MNPSSPAEAPAPEPESDELFRRLFAAIPVALAPLFAVTVLIGEGLLESVPTFVEFVLVAIAFASGLYPSALLVSRRGRRYFVEHFVPTGWFGVVLLAASTLYILFMSTWGFAVLTGSLHDHGITRTQPADLDSAANELFNAFLWSFLNAIPTIEIPRTLGWEEPLRFTDHVTPPLLLLYKLAVILPVIATATVVVRRARRPPRAHKSASSLQRPS